MASPENEEKKPRPRLPARRLLALARPELRTLLIAVGCLVVGSAAELLFPQQLQRIIDGALSVGGEAAVNSAAIQLLAIFGIQSVAVALRYYFFNVAGERVVARLREGLYRSIISQEIAFFDQRRTGELTNRLASDTTVLQNTVSINLSMLLRNTASVVGGTALLLWTSPPLTLVMLAIVPVVSVGAVLVGRRLRKLSREVQDALASASSVAEETFSGLRTVRAFTQEEGESQRYADAVWKSFDLARRRSRASSTFAAVVAFAGYGAVAAVVWYGGRLVLGGTLSVGQLSSFVVYTLIVAFSLASLSELWADFMRASGAAERIFELLDRTPEIPMRGGVQPDHATGSVALEGVRFTYPARPDVEVLKGIDLSISPGEIVALVGPSGSGKSTIAGLLTRLYDPSRGHIRFDGVPLTELDPGWLRRHVGVVSQEPTLFSTSIAQNIRYGREGATDEEIEKAARAANAHDFIQKFPEGYQTAVGERGVQLSGGQKQRIAIARALLRDPKLLILDEATSALDAESEHLVKEALDRLMKGRTTLIIAHRLSTVRDANRVIVLSEGAILQQGTHEALLQQDGLYKRLVARQLGDDALH